MREHTFHDIDSVIDDVHGLFDSWVEYAKDNPVEEQNLLVMKLAVHEWIANLVQHAVFSKSPPLIHLVISPAMGGLHCLVEDNSEGFDLKTQINEQSKALKGPELAERGRGLLMMIGCTENLAYETSNDDLQRLEFVVRPPGGMNKMDPLFPTADQALGQV